MKCILGTRGLYPVDDIHHSCPFENHKIIVEQLLRCFGLTVDIADNSGRTTLWLAACDGHVVREDCNNLDQSRTLSLSSTLTTSTITTVISANHAQTNDVKYISIVHVLSIVLSYLGPFSLKLISVHFATDSVDGNMYFLPTTTWYFYRFRFAFDRQTDRLRT